MASRKAISILGSTGSIGTSTLDIVRMHPDRFEVLGLACGKNLAEVKKQIAEFHPKIVSVSSAKDAQVLREELSGHHPLPEIVCGVEGASAVATYPGVRMVIAAVVGAAGLTPTLQAVKKGIDIGLANKETLVVAGELVSQEAKKSGSTILPVDSEHNALFQALHGPKGFGKNTEEVSRLILTASGGPFRNLAAQDLENVSPEQALKHPNWSMGAKITIDSATMMNKGLEVIEAHFLFGLPLEKIKILIHPQSIVHSLVEYIDGSHLAQLGVPDMRIPIAYALSYPDRLPLDLPRLNLAQIGKLEFFEPDSLRFPAIRLAFDALREGKTLPCVLNAANEVAIPYFLNRRIKFTQISQSVETVMNLHAQKGLQRVESLEQVLAVDSWAREACENLIQTM